jgi:hypothetical protein
MAMNIRGGISKTASFENIQLMAAIKVTQTSSRSDLRALDKVILGSPGVGSLKSGGV